MLILEADILQLEGKLVKDNNARNYQLLLEKKMQLWELIQEKAAGLLLRLRVRNLKDFDTPNKAFFRWDSVSKSPNHIFSVFDSNGTVIAIPKDVRLCVKDFFLQIVYKTNCL